MTVELHGLRVFGRHGVLEHERRDGQDFLFAQEIKQASGNDDVGVVVATRPGIGNRSLSNIEFWLSHIENGAGFAQLCIELWTL